MYLFSIRHNSEQNNEKQLNLAYKENEKFLDEFVNFEFYYKFEVKDQKLFNALNFNIDEYR